MPGHTTAQAAVVVEDDGIVFTSDNIFCKVHTWLQEADPAAWLTALESLRALRAETLSRDAQRDDRSLPDGRRAGRHGADGQASRAFALRSGPACTR
jgi:glyoxylase-like metal-dependent hydrolase (beta-lactamase superfamily II)